MIKTQSINVINNHKELLTQVESIFFEASSKKEFTSLEHKAAFFQRWCGDYIKNYPEEFFVMTEDGHLLGYLSGCSDSRISLQCLSVPGLEVFSDQFEDYPAHLHINFHATARGRGLGSELIKTYESYLRNKNVKGLHLITSPEALNVSFYRRLGYIHEVEREFKGMQLLFMGHILD